ncbi:MAG TPA: hypothetical protein VD813_01395 [Pseudonocardia sp.]|nr:hypothetical protein [Pseudonocardia sp.]
MLAALGLVLVTAAPVLAQQLFDLEWRVTTRIERWVGSGLVPQVVVREGERRGRGPLTVVPAPGPDAVLAFHLGGDAGGGAGRVLPGGQGRLDETSAFPRALTTDQGPLPQAGPRGVAGTFRVVGSPASPTRVEILHVETFVCRATPRVCGNVKLWEHVFTGTGRPMAGAPTVSPTAAP